MKVKGTIGGTHLRNSDGKLLYKKVNGKNKLLFNPIYFLSDEMKENTLLSLSSFRMTRDEDLSLSMRRTSDQETLDVFTKIGGVDKQPINDFDDGSYIYGPTWYDQSGNNNNATQTTATLQPNINGYIAPNDKLSFYIPYPNQRTIGHDNIIFDEEDQWSLTLCLNWDGYSRPSRRTNICFTNTPGEYFARSQIFLNFNWSFIMSMYNQTRPSPNHIIFSGYNSRNLLGRNRIVTITADGSLGEVKVYVEGYLVLDQDGRYTSVIFENWLRGTNRFNGKFWYARVQSGVMSEEDVIKERDLIRSVIPDIMSVKIGTQKWALNNFTLSTSISGHVIPNVENEINEDQITNGDFSDPGDWDITGDVTIENNEAVFNEVGEAILSQPGSVNLSSSLVKISYEITEYTSGSIQGFTHNWTTRIFGKERDSVGTYTEYIRNGDRLGGGQPTGPIGLYTSDGFVGKVSNLSIERVGWSQLNEAYDWFISDGDDESEAIAKCAAWCYYDNGIPNGVIYGKLYNWYAVRKIQDDFDQLKEQTPFDHFGWKIPTDNEYDKLIEYLGGEGVAGDKLKLEGTKYWNEPNTGTNESGFSSLGSGIRTETGDFTGLKETTSFHTLDEPEEEYEKLLGYPIRLLKDETFTTVLEMPRATSEFTFNDFHWQTVYCNNSFSGDIKVWSFHPTFDGFSNDCTWEFGIQTGENEYQVIKTKDISAGDDGILIEDISLTKGETYYWGITQGGWRNSDDIRPFVSYYVTVQRSEYRRSVLEDGGSHPSNTYGIGKVEFFEK